MALINGKNRFKAEAQFETDIYGFLALKTKLVS